MKKNKLYTCEYAKTHINKKKTDVNLTVVA